MSQLNIKMTEKFTSFKFVETIIFLFALLVSFDLPGQVQVGNDINVSLNITSIALSGDGSRVVIGESGYRLNFQLRGRFRSFELVGDTWLMETANWIVGPLSNPSLGSGFATGDVVLTDDGSSLLMPMRNFVCDENTGQFIGKTKMYDYNLGSMTWISFETPFFEVCGLTPNELFGWAADMASTNHRFVVGAPNFDDGAGFPTKGAVCIYERDPLNGYQPLLQQNSTGGGGSRLTGDAVNPTIGIKTKISDDGSRIAVLGSGFVKVFDFVPSPNDPYLGDYVQVGNTLSGYSTTSSAVDIEMSGDGQRLIIEQSSPSGFIQTFDFNGINWVDVGPTIFDPPSTQFRGIALSNDGTTLYYLRKNFAPNPDNLSLFVATRIGNDWVQLGNELIIDNTSSLLSIAANAPVVAINSGISSCRIYDYTSVLPITLQSFTAEPTDKSVRLAWQTATEENTQNFTLERSTDGGRTFAPIGSVAALDRREGAEYTFIDEDLPSAGGQLYYRLIARDFDGAQEGFGPVAVILEGSALSNLQVIPNPATAAASVQILGANAGAKVELMAMDGRYVATLKATDDAGTNFLLPALKPGIYLLRVTTGRAESKIARLVIR